MKMEITWTILVLLGFSFSDGESINVSTVSSSQQTVAQTSTITLTPDPNDISSTATTEATTTQFSNTRETSEETSTVKDGTSPAPVSVSTFSSSQQTVAQTSTIPMTSTTDPTNNNFNTTATTEATTTQIITTDFSQLINETTTDSHVNKDASSSTLSNPSTSTNPYTEKTQPTTSAYSNKKNGTSPTPVSVSTVSSQKPVAQTSTIPMTSTTDQTNNNFNTTATTKATTPQIITNNYSLSKSEEGVLIETCKTLNQKMNGNCSVNITRQGKQLKAIITIDADQVEDKQIATDDVDAMKGTIPDTLIAILASCGALVLILCCFAAYCTYHRRSYRKNQQHLTEELQPVENGYHDNPTLEVMEVQPEMQEKKVALNGEFNDSWIVPIDNLLKEDLVDEEDTHL